MWWNDEMLQTFAILQEKDSKGDSEIIRATIPPGSKTVSTFVSKDRTATQQSHLSRSIWAGLHQVRDGVPH